MKQDISKDEFIRSFNSMGREDNFTFNGRGALYDYLEDLYEQIDEEYNLDVIALCCEYSEYADIEEFQSNYGDEYETMEDIENSTTVIPVSGDSFIIQQF